MEIIIKDSNKEKINKAIEQAEGKAVARTINYETVVDIVNRLERRLERIQKTHLQGVTAHYSGAEHFPNAYKYVPYSTHVDLVYKYGSWRLASVYRDICPNRSSDLTVKLTSQAINNLIDAYEKGRY